VEKNAGGRLTVTMQWEFNAKTQSRQDAKEEDENGSQANAHRMETRMGRDNFFFAPWRLGAFALKSSILTAWFRLIRVSRTKSGP
jgi:hypothetical protein